LIALDITTLYIVVIRYGSFRFGHYLSIPLNPSKIKVPADKKSDRPVIPTSPTERIIVIPNPERGEG
jgi:hypothetical protein